MKKPIGTILAGSLSILALAFCYTIPANSAETSGQANHELTVSYFRAWRDTHSNAQVNANAMSDLPPEVDIAVAFPDDLETTQNFWDTLPDQINTLHTQGTRVIRSLDIRVFYQDTFPNVWEQRALSPMSTTEQGYATRAQEIRDGLLNISGLDGLVINAEATMSADDVTRAIGTIKALSAYYGPRSGNNTILAFNTNRPGTDPLFQGISDTVSYVFADAYGRSVSRVQSDWETYRGLISSKQYIPGFSFYEEKGFTWHDTDAPLNTSRAAQYARWEPTADGHKGGIFGYAVDRDGAQIGQDQIVHTTFEWTKELAKIMNP